MTASKKKLTLDRPVMYQVTIPGLLDQRHADWTGGLTIATATDCDGCPVTTLTGSMDQAALQGLLRRLYGLGLPLLAVTCLERA